MELTEKFKDYTHLYARENVWAHKYHDSIRGKKHLEELAIYPGTWAANYSMFYILNRIMAQYQPQNILELGLGETSKFINTYLRNYNEGEHTIVEHDLKWAEFVEGDFSFGKDSKILHVPMTQKIVDNQEINVYGQQLLDIVDSDKYDLYLIDGPIGSKQFSRYDIVDIAKQNIDVDDQFIMILDDNDRDGEIQTREELLKVLDEQGVKYYTNVYVGIKTIFLICTEDFKYAATF